MKRLFFIIILLTLVVSVFGSNYNIRQIRNSPFNEEVFHNKWTNSARGDSLNCTVVGRALFGLSFNVFVRDTIAYSCNGNSLLILNVSDPNNPILLSFYDTGSYAYGVYVKDTIAYVADYDDGLRLINVSNPSSPTEIGFYDTGGDVARGVYVRDTIAYVADSIDGLYLIHYCGGGAGIKENKNRNRINVCNIVVKMQDGLSTSYNIEETKNVSISIYNIMG